ncbi:hypothetical protein VCHA43P277_160123 [Vibrio chagasii]|nr:hypothetical protein VCHA43P277_160123 [Vibrio chagasii]CAH7037264.1 hypothetical protein VCHA41O247_160124 [Vibrio chagasii]CAH7245598.1 hypothetical protein VCHA50P420_160076 [Vibrio chagasii]
MWIDSNNCHSSLPYDCPDRAKKRLGCCKIVMVAIGASETMRGERALCRHLARL